MMTKWAKVVVDKYVNGGSALVLMGALWLYIWLFVWYDAYVHDPHWGHNFAEALAFLAVGLDYFNRRLVSNWLGLGAASLIIPVSLELLPHEMTAVIGGVLVALIIVDMMVERGRREDLGQSANRRLTIWLKRHLPRFSYVMLGHLALVYFFVRLAQGTYETTIVTKVYDGLLIPFILLVLLEDSVSALGRVPTKALTFFMGMATMLISLLVQGGFDETWVVLSIIVAANLVAILSLILNKRSLAAG